MPTQPPSDRTRAKGGPPVFNPGLSAGDPPRPKKCETNPIPQGRPPKNAKRTQSQPRPTTQMRKTNPIYTPANSQSPTANSCFLRNEPNFHRLADPTVPRISKTNPITAYRWRPAGFPAPHCAKRTQSPYRWHLPGPTIPSLCETNPIYELPTTNYEPKIRNEPNFHPHCHPERRAAERSAAAQSQGICSITIAGGDSTQTNPGRTQMRKTNPIIPPAGPNPGDPGNHELPTTNYELYYAKQTQFTRTAGVSLAFRSPIMRNKPIFRPAGSLFTIHCSLSTILRNEPNLPRWLPQKCETNPIYPYPSLAHDPDMQNEPNFRTASVSPAFRPPPPLCETNPITGVPD